MISLHQFYFDAIQLAHKNKWGYGQAMFNHLMQVRPDLAEQVRGKDKDPYHVTRLDDPRWDRFVEFIETRWYVPETWDRFEAAVALVTAKSGTEDINRFVEFIETNWYVPET